MSVSNTSGFAGLHLVNSTAKNTRALCTLNGTAISEGDWFGPVGQAVVFGSAGSESIPIYTDGVALGTAQEVRLYAVID